MITKYSEDDTDVKIYAINGAGKVLEVKIKPGLDHTIEELYDFDTPISDF